MPQHAQLKADALINLEDFLKAFSKANREKILSNERIDMSEILKMDEYTKFNQAIADLNKYLSVNSVAFKEVK